MILRQKQILEKLEGEGEITIKELATRFNVSEMTIHRDLDSLQKDKVISHFAKATDVYTLNEFVGDELEIVDPYGGALPAYGLCYEMLRKSIKKLVKILSEGEYKWQK